MLGGREDYRYIIYPLPTLLKLHCYSQYTSIKALSAVGQYFRQYGCNKHFINAIFLERFLF